MHAYLHGIVAFKAAEDKGDAGQQQGGRDAAQWALQRCRRTEVPCTDTSASALRAESALAG